MISALRDWFAANRLVLLFFYGQMFFTMGVAVAIQTRRHSRLALARSLPWLSAFSLLHAFYLWGEPVIYLLQVAGTHASTEMITVLKALQVLFLGGSFGALFQFGLTLAAPFTPRWRWLEWTALGAFLAWFLAFYVGLALGTDLARWQDGLSALARYGLGLPGGLLAAWGLRLQAKRRLLALDLTSIYNMLRVAGLALVAFALVAALAVPPLPFFPARVINAVRLSQFLAVPVEVVLALISGVFAIAIIRALEVFNIETRRLLDRMEQAQLLSIERQRIARELHDGALQRVYAAGLLAQSLRREIRQGPLTDKFDRLLEALDNAIKELRQFLTTLQSPAPESQSSQVDRVLQSLVEEAARISGTEILYRGEPLTLSPTRAAHLISFAHEALSNAIRHARTSQIQVTLKRQGSRAWLVVEDHGVGLPANLQKGYGLRNMEDRARLLGGEVRFESRPGQGTRVILSIPLEERHEQEDPTAHRGRP